VAVNGKGCIVTQSKITFKPISYKDVGTRGLWM